MQGWSWMAALTLVAGMAGAFTPIAPGAEPPPVKQKVNLSLRLDGLSAAGGEIEIKPGHAGCRFETIKFDTKSHPTAIDGKIYLDAIEVETVSADRDCCFAITLKEPGQSDKTVRRTLRIVPSKDEKTAKPQSFTCYLSSNSLKPIEEAKVDDESRAKSKNPDKPAKASKKK